MSDDVPQWVAQLIYGPSDMYDRYTSAFVMKNGLKSMDAEHQLDVVKEELDELEEALEHWLDQDRDTASPNLEEELADVIHSVYVLGQITNADLLGTFEEKARYNLKKSGKRDETGKIMDDVNEN